MHTDSAEEILYIVAGTGEAVVGDDRDRLIEPGSLAADLQRSVPALIVDELRATRSIRVGRVRS